ncbi:protein TolQ [Parendozoicomonas haliclonae]|uniref:Tol-Pal system protein TolQ n=1 Tax=Parendozoicomonas haliclonae TaxID=1960125 RepID=A0A1X7AFP4_9GAMM|nr:protein TolQ [Parendozoicomonas haliclonae]SMA36473.1 Biopolymer transport protein ExbB [Parendozoicomonas haliclonae]
MTENTSMWALVLDAGWFVQLILLMLIAASVLSWVFIVQRSIVLRNARKAAVAFEDRFWSGMDLGQLYREVHEEADKGTGTGMERIFMAGFREFTRLRGKGMDADALMDGVQRSMRVAVTREQERLETNLPFLATVGSTGPYVGLFGTVVGVMNSFRGLAGVQQTTLAAVAPGIAEALVTTAVGLVAAIPAVVAYNRFNARVESLLTSYETFAEEFSSILHRQVHGKSRAQGEG